MNYFGYEPHRSYGNIIYIGGAGVMTATEPFPYMKDAAEVIKNHGVNSVLILGYGLGYGPAYVCEHTGADITAVDISDYIVNNEEAAHKKLDWFEPEIIVSDAMEFMVETVREWDAAIVDLFDGSMKAPDFVIENAFTEKLDRIISGPIIYNLYLSQRSVAIERFNSLGRQNMYQVGRPVFVRA